MAPCKCAPRRMGGHGGRRDNRCRCYARCDCRAEKEGNDGVPAATSTAAAARPDSELMSAGGMIPGAIDAREHDLLERLGLDERATPEDVARTRDELQAFLAAAPKSIRGWARRQASAADEAYVLLSDPTARIDGGALPTSPARSASQPDGPDVGTADRFLRG